MFFINNRKYEAERKALLATNPSNTALKHYLSKPFPDFKTLLSDLEFCSLDFETTGLNPDTDAIIQVGYTTIKNATVLFSQNVQQNIKIDTKLPRNSVTIHKITDEELEKGKDLNEVFSDLLIRISGKVIVAHFKQIEYRFIQAVSQKLFNHHLPIMMIDTMELGKKKLERSSVYYPTNSLRLYNLRSHFCLLYTSPSPRDKRQSRMPSSA